MKAAAVMDETLHIILTGEHGRVRSLAISKRKLKIFFYFSFTFLVTLLFMSFAGIYFYSNEMDMRFRLGNLKQDLDQTKSNNNNLQEVITGLKKEKESLVKNAVSELEKRSRIIETILGAIGIDVQEKKREQSSGGPFIFLGDEAYEDVLLKADAYLEKIKPLPLGFPVLGRVTSGYGKRIDPINKRSAFHAGIDVMSRSNTKVKAPADGRVFRKGYDSDYGYYIILDHGNGYKTLFGHLKKILIKKGQSIERGEVIGLIGSTGRSTGPHLHYEIRYRGKTVNPWKYVNIARRIARGQES
jgi:murein DD-endopeptidase MepM/ murein hydrolase activator NlpD